MYTRRGVLRGSVALGLGGVFKGGIAWSRDTAVRAILPAATHDTLALKVLLDHPPSGPLSLAIDGRDVRGRPVDRDAYAWQFVQGGLKSGTDHSLLLRDNSKRPLREPWRLRTLPQPDAQPSRVRLLFFTCAGGDEEDGYLSIADRRALFDRALSFSPDLAVANGDHVYWDLWTALKYLGTEKTREANAALHRRIAWIDEDVAFDSPTNRQALNTVIGRQIASIYEDRFASVPLFFISDDHDYFENDNAGSWGSTFPPRPFILNLQRLTAAMAYPVALGRPNFGNPVHAETVETLRYGRLLEMALFDCRRGWSKGRGARYLFPEAENFLIKRLQASTAQQYLHVPSLPFGTTAGKLGDWYADPPSIRSTYGVDKDFWQKGWFDEHQRLVRALSAQKGRAAITIAGDMHASVITTITRSGDIDLSANPIHAVLPGPLGTGASAFPSAARGLLPQHPAALAANDVLKLEERNGFSIVDVTPEQVEVRQFRWRPPEPAAAIAALAPYASFTIPKPS